MRIKHVLSATLFAVPLLVLPASASAWPIRFYRPMYPNYYLAYQNAARMAAYQQAMRSAMYQNATRAAAYRNAMRTRAYPNVTRAGTYNNSLGLVYGRGHVPHVSPTLGSNPAIATILRNRSTVHAVGGSSIRFGGDTGPQLDDNGDPVSN